MKKIALLLSLIILFLNSCKTNPAAPVDNIPEGKRNYEWTVDTIKIPFTYLYRISGSSSEDVWAVGPGGGLDQTIWHFNGSSWNTDGISRMISPLSVISFSRNNVWIAGNEGNIWQFNGTDWKPKFKFVKNGHIAGFRDIWGTDSSNIFAVGYADSGNTRKAVILNYNGKAWSEKKISDYSCSFQRIKKDYGVKGKYYIIGDDVQYNLISLFEYSGDKISKTYEASYTPSNAIYPNVINNKLYITKGNKIFSIENGKYSEITTINENNFGIQIFGRSEKDIFLRMLDGIAHYNGSDVEYLYRFNSSDNISITDAVVFENSVFFLANDIATGINLIFRGKIKCTPK